MPPSSPTAERAAVELPIPAEPASLRAEVERDPRRAAPLIADASVLLPTFWEAWGAALEPAGVSEARLLEILRDYRRELWLWAVGERPWVQCAEGLAGRVRRRL